MSTVQAYDILSTSLDDVILDCSPCSRTAGHYYEILDALLCVLSFLVRHTIFLFLPFIFHVGVSGGISHHFICGSLCHAGNGVSLLVIGLGYDGFVGWVGLCWSGVASADYYKTNY